MSEVYPWIGFKRKEDRNRFKSRIFSEYKKIKPSVAEGSGSRPMNDREIRHILHIRNARYGEGETFYIISDLVKMPEGLYWLVFCGWWEILEKLEEIIQKEYKDYVFLVAD